MADIIKFGDAAATFDRDRKVWKLLVSGMSERQAAAEAGCTVAEVNGAMVRMINGVPPDLRTRTITLELARFDEIYAAFYPLVVNTRNDPNFRPNSDAAAMLLRVADQRAKLLGLNAPPTGDKALDDAMKNVKETSTERVRAAINRIRGRTSTVIDGEAVTVDKPED